MKRFFKSLAMATVIAMCSANASAQGFGGERPERQSVEEIAKTQGTSIAKSLKLKKAQTKKFVATYTEYLKEMQQLRPQMGPGDRRRPGQRGEGNDQRPPRQRPVGQDSMKAPAPRQRGERRGEPSEEMKQKMAETQKKIQALRNKYASAYAEYLSPEQIAKIYDLEKKIEQQRRQEMRQRFEQMRQMGGQMGGGGRGGWGDDDF